MRPFSLALLAATLLAAPLAAQETITFTVDQANSDFHFGGDTNLGPINGVPNGNFEMAGWMDVDVTAGAIPVEAGSLTGSDLYTVPGTLSAEIPNPIPWLPPLAEMDLIGARLSLTSPNFTVDGSGNFTAMVTTTFLSGIIDVRPITGSPFQMDLAGMFGAPSASSGTITVQPGGGFHSTAPIDARFDFSDPTSGISGYLDIVGTLVADWGCPTPIIYCTAKVNSQGCTPQIATTGFPSYSDPTPFDVSASGIINKKNGLLFYGYGPNNVPFQGGILCVAPPIRRTSVQNSGGSSSGTDCTGTFSYDFNALIQSQTDGNLAPGAGAFMQYWSRDPASPSTTNLTDAVEVTICS